MENSQQGIILHDYFGIMGGGERLVSLLARSLGWPVLTGFTSGCYANAFSKDEFYTGAGRFERLLSLNCYQGLPPLQIMSLIRGFRDRSTSYLRDYSPVLYSGTYAPLAVLRSPAPANIYYCHSPARFIYDQRDFYFSSLPFWQRPLLSFLVNKLQPLYESALPKMDAIIANSANVRKRLHHYLGLESVVVHPPCETNRFHWRKQGDFYLSTARLDPLKRVDLIIEAFKQMPEKKLVVVSGGGEMMHLQKSAADADNIKFAGWVSESQLLELMGDCIATIYIPRDEDFGMSPVESMAAGKPVIGVREGGLLETVGDLTTEEGRRKTEDGKDGETCFTETECGVLLRPDPGVGDIVEAVQYVKPEKALEKREACEKRAEFFDSTVFEQKMRKVLSGPGSMV